MLKAFTPISTLLLLSSLTLGAIGLVQGDALNGGVAGAAVGGYIGGPQGAVAGAVLGAVGGDQATQEKNDEQARWKNYYDQQQQREQAAQQAPVVVEQAMAETERPLPSGSGLIKEIQRSLTVLGYAPGPIDGLTDGPTIDAIRHYQEDNGLMTTGKASRELLVHLRQNGG